MNGTSYAVIGVIVAWLTPASAEIITLAGPPGALPPTFEPALTGKGERGRWQVVEDRSAADGTALAQLSTDRTDYRFPLAIYKPTMLKDVEASIRFKAISGSVDQAGGVAVRLQNASNYYLARANALEDNVRFYRVKEGSREELAGANLKVTSSE